MREGIQAESLVRQLAAARRGDLEEAREPVARDVDVSVRTVADYCYWRTNHGVEVDLLVEKHGTLRRSSRPGG